MATGKATKKKNFISDFFSGEVNEIKRIIWPKFSEIMESTGKVLVFCIAFALFFILCDLVIGKLLLLIGVGL